MKPRLLDLEFGVLTITIDCASHDLYSAWHYIVSFNQAEPALHVVF